MDSCDSALSLNTPHFKSADGQWRPTEGTLFDALRANAAHQVKTIMDSSDPKNPNFNSPANRLITYLHQARGTIIGDFHLLNLSDIELSNHIRKIGVVDVDDGGVNAPLIIDVTRALIGATISGFDISTSKALSTYLFGLSGKAPQKPKLVLDAEAVTPEEFIEQQIAWLEKITSDKKFNKKSKVQNLSEGSPEVRSLYELVHKDFEKLIGGKKILDIGFRMKSTGGSQLLPRFWFLVENKNMPKNLEVLEFKYEGRSAADLASPQPEHSDRVAAVSKEFRPREKIYGTYSVVTTPSGAFLARTRMKNQIEIDLTEDYSQKEKKEIADLYLYYIHLLGSDHSQQLGANNLLVKTLSIPDNQELLMKWCLDYIRTMQKLNMGQN